MYFQIKKYNKKLVISFKNNFLLFKNKFHIFSKDSFYLKNVEKNPKNFRINPKRIKVPKVVKETQRMFQQKLETLDNKNSPLRVNLSFSFSLKFSFSHSKNEFYAISLPYSILKYKGLSK